MRNLILNNKFIFLCLLFVIFNSKISAQLCNSTDVTANGIVPEQSSFPGGEPQCNGLSSYRFDPVSNQTYTDAFGNWISITVSSTPCGPVFSWEAIEGIEVDFIHVKGGSNQGENVNIYTYDDNQTSDSNLHSPLNPNNGIYYGLSHIDFCYHYKLSASKTAVTSYSRTYAWSIDKLCLGSSELTLSNGQVYDYPFSWTASVSSFDDSDFAVNGNITVQNNSPFGAVITSIDDVLSNGIVASVVCEGISFPYTLESGNSLNCTYTSSLESAVDGINTVTVSTSSLLVEGDIAYAGYAFGAPTTEIDKCVTVSDDCTASVVVCLDDAPLNHAYSCPITYNECGDFVYTNTATMTSNDNLNVSTDACQVAVSVPCGGCTLTIGYWKTHSEIGPAPYDETWAELDNGASTIFYLSGASYYDVAWTAPAGNAYYILAHQFIAAQLNMLNGADFGAAQAAFDQATILFETYTPNYIATLKGKNPLRQLFISLSTTLDNYNNGIIGPGHCDDDLLQVRSKEENSYNSEVVNHVRLSPNPASSYVQIDLSSFIGQSLDVKIFNKLGAVILQNKVLEVDQSILNIELDQNIFSNGLYFVTIQNDSEIISLPMILMRE